LTLYKARQIHPDSIIIYEMEIINWLGMEESTKQRTSYFVFCPCYY